MKKKKDLFIDKSQAGTCKENVSESVEDEHCAACVRWTTEGGQPRGQQRTGTNSVRRLTDEFRETLAAVDRFCVVEWRVFVCVRACRVCACVGVSVCECVCGRTNLSSIERRRGGWTRAAADDDDMILILLLLHNGVDNNYCYRRVTDRRRSGFIKYFFFEILLSSRRFK